MLQDIVEYSKFYIFEQNRERYKNHVINNKDKIAKHRRDIIDKPYITFISPELGENNFDL